MSKTKHGWHSVPACLNSIGAVAIGTALGVGLCAASALAADASWISTVTVDGTPGARCRTADLPRYRIEIRDGRFTATTDTTEAVAQSEYVVIVVPLFVTAEGEPTFGWMDDATRAIAAGLKPGTTVIYETTLPVGTTRTRWKPMLEEGSGSFVALTQIDGVSADSVLLENRGDATFGLGAEP